MRRLALFVAASVLVPLAAFGQTSDAARGKAAFMRYGCYSCHGTVGQGIAFAGPRIAPGPPAWSVVSAYVRKPGGQMPSFDAKVLPEQDLADIYAYLKAIPQTRPASQIPALSGINTTPR